MNAPIDQVNIEQRVAMLGRRSIKNQAKIAGLKMAISMMDLTTLEGKDSAGKVAAMCRKAIRPQENDSEIPSVAAVCVYPNMVPVAKKAVAGSRVKVASVATAFPSGLAPLAVKLDEVKRVVDMGADEVDMVINRGEFLSGNYKLITDEITQVKAACGPAHLKVILETGELETYDNVRTASFIAMQAGADFIKTSTGKAAVNATLPVTLVMLEAIRDYYYLTGKKIGMKPAGGIRTAKQALQYLVLVNETLGDAWLTKDLFRFGASTLLNDVLMQIAKQASGRYQSGDYFTKD